MMFVIECIILDFVIINKLEIGYLHSFLNHAEFLVPCPIRPRANERHWGSVCYVRSPPQHPR
jgi:hypothetical protein